MLTESARNLKRVNIALGWLFFLVAIVAVVFFFIAQPADVEVKQLKIQNVNADFKSDSVQEPPYTLELSAEVENPNKGVKASNVDYVFQIIEGANEDSVFEEGGNLVLSPEGSKQIKEEISLSKTEGRSLRFKIPNIKWKVVDIQKVEDREKEEIEEETGPVNCGDSISLIAADVSLEDRTEAKELVKTDRALKCLGNNMVEGCQSSYVSLKTKSRGKLKVSVKGKVAEKVCEMKVEYGNTDQIPKEEHKGNANSSISCPVDIMKKGNFDSVEEAGKNSSQLAFSSILYLTLDAVAAESGNECEGDLLEKQNSE